ncbi:uncharacterized protein FA14DRAFT_34461 [Meira miltonrushii]|uniref:BZIP domain-containing protein n=1 Tax=Meira miltonrushii TaxID=1280837 RepID=A0A316VB12_9BASI|nr:uncharacterized protein FA14DRAFT_34461 [Meira miltonrushii]PWN34817.1 hypothetical protein FA14DRAFT_34461 [Meira miltonrushii]
MAPVIKPATNQSVDYADFNQLKRKSEDDIDVSLGFETFSQGEEDEEDDEGDDVLALKRSTKKTGDQPVSKRTLQNRKAQREFRKRREARVRELEERCRRFDQMGLEANGELQRAARGLKEENDALRGFIMRMGFGHMIPNVLQDVGNQRNNGDDQFYQQTQQQPTFSGGMFSNAQPNSSNFNEPTFFIDPSTAVQSANAPMNNSRGRSHTIGNGNEHRSSSSSSSPNKNNNIDAEKMAGGITLPMPMNYGSMTLAPTPQPANMRSGISQRSGSGTQKQDNIKGGQSSSPSSSKSTDNGDTPFLTLSLNNQSRKQDGRQSGNQQSQPQFTQPKQDNDSNNNDMNGLSSLFGGSNNGMGSGGTAMLQNFNNSFPVPQRSRQNAALLNPNPIPFSFNLASGDLASQQPTWWEQMGGGSEQVELDDKAQAVANAQQGNQAPSPFDLGAFLQGGITPGGGFQLGNIGGSQPGSQPNSTIMSHDLGRTGSTDSDHMRMFIQLMERKMAERDACTFASLGFQPPSQDPAQRTKQQQQQQGITSEMTPSGVYSRLAQHPAFLSTNAREMEELMDALGPSTWNRQDGKTGDDADKDESKDSGKDQSSNHGKSSRSNSSASPLSPGRVHVDENAIGKLMGLLDQKRNSNAKSFNTSPHEDNQQRFTMAMA